MKFRKSPETCGYSKLDGRRTLLDGRRCLDRTVEEHQRTQESSKR